ncbi:MAG: S8 family peptidase [Bacteroidota bacterium]
MEQFPHLNFVQKVTGKPRFPGGGKPHPSTQHNRENRQQHSNRLSNKTNNVKSTWDQDYSQRESLDLAPLDDEIVPVFLQLNPSLLNNASLDLHAFGIEIISEEDDGYIIGASLDKLRSLEDKIKGFVTKEHNTGKIADLWNIIDGDRQGWKPERILSEELYAKWASIQDTKQYKVEVSIAFDRPISEEPDPTKRGGEKRLEKYQQKLIERDELLLERQNHFEHFIAHYEGEITSSIIDLEDSFGCEVLINGKGLKDLVFNYPFVFEVVEVEEVGGVEGEDIDPSESDTEVLPPDGDAPEVGVIDSGIMESHRYISAAINSSNSKSYIDGEPSTADLVKGGGHGTKVAGAILYPYGVSNLESPYQIPCFVRNLKVLDKQNSLINRYPAELMQLVVDDNPDCFIFNLSINSRAPYRTKHMSTWAAVIDNLSHERDILFIISTGNIPRDVIQYYLTNEHEYPEYLHESNCRLANPAQSSFALTVGSINHAAFDDEFWESLGGEGDISAFSRIGTGIWGAVKPDVVEYGGGFTVSKNGHHRVKEVQDIAPELIRSTRDGGSAYGRDTVGTSFAAPKVAHMVAQLRKLYPEENANLLRALVVQGARLPSNHFLDPSVESIRYFGYGLPSLERVTSNTEQRITFYNTGQLKAEEGHIYSLKIPEELRNPALEYEILIEVTLAYSAKVRRTRQKTKSYLSTWLDWTTSKLEETFDSFRNYALREIAGNQTEYDKKGRKGLSGFNWKIRDRVDWGEVEGINRNNSTVQKDWAILSAYELPEEIGFAVRAHKGWDKNKEEVPYALVVSIEVLDESISIYEPVRIENEVEIPIRT